MSPEQVRGQAADHRSDIFAFGAVVLEMLTGERAFTGDSMIEAMSAILKVDPLERAVATGALTPSIEMVVRHCLEKQPDERFQSARDLAFQLHAIASGSFSSGAIAALGPVAGSRSKPLLFAIGAACLVVGVIAGGALAWPWRSSSSRPGVTTVFTADPPAAGAISNGNTTLPRGLIAVSPDGTRIVYRMFVDKVNRLYVRSLDSLRSSTANSIDHR
jgi:serine/threonine protein kinase